MARHERSFGRYQAVLDLEHYLDVLERKSTVQARYGLQTCQVFYAAFCTGGFSSFLASTTGAIAAGWNEPAPGRDFHPL